MIWKFTVRHILTRPFSAFLTLIAITISLSMLGGFWTVVENLERVRVTGKQSITNGGIAGLTVFVDPKLSENELENFKMELLESPRFASANIVPSEQALESLKLQFGDTLSKVFDEESLPVTMNLQFASGSLTRTEFLNLLNDLRSRPGVLDVDEGLGAFSPKQEAVSERVFSWATGLLLLVFVVVALLVSHLIRLAFEAIRGEIETLKILGASRGRIFAPLFLEGMIFGIAGGVLSIGCVTIFFKYIVPHSQLFLLPSEFQMTALSINSSLSLAGLGILASVAGAFLTWPLIDQPAQEL
ncbi:FtsX-like permease family protein [bacterium]|nr:FtsX-like permease family protein [bacterium]